MAPREVWVLQGPNLALLGRREPERYGRQTLAEITAQLDALAPVLGLYLTHHVSNHEGALLDLIHGAHGRAEGLIINPGGLGHTSVSLRDALLGVGLPFVEVHLSNIHAREPFRHRTLLSDVAAGVVTGFGAVGYELALRGLAARLGPPPGAPPGPDTATTPC